MNENKKALKELEDFYESLPAPFFLTEDLNFKYFKKYLKVFNKIEKEIKKRKEVINNPKFKIKRK